MNVVRILVRELQPRSTCRRLICALPVLVVLLVPSKADAWADHWAITRAAISVLPADSPLRGLLGDEIGPLIGTYSVHPDFPDRLIWVQSLGDWWFYTDDYLLFPTVNYHIGHEMPEVAATFRPYFRRALQALRTENWFNAARWIGSFLHFVQDSGAPPHAYHYKDQRPDDHGLMEGLMTPDHVWIPGYKPALLGRTESDAEHELERRMAGLVGYSSIRAQGMVAFAHANNTAALGPIEDEVARECARVTADVLYTLGELAVGDDARAGALQGTIISDSAPGMEGVTAKVVLEGTNYSTVALWNGDFAFHNLPAGSYSATVLRPGSEPASWPIVIRAGAVSKRRFEMPALDPGNLLRNPGFSVRWLRRGLPDGWNQVGKGWLSEWLQVFPGRAHRFTALRADRSGTAIIRWSRDPDSGPRSEYELPSERNRIVITAPVDACWARVFPRTEFEPQDAFRRVSVCLDSEIIGQRSLPAKGAKLFAENFASPDVDAWRAFGTDGRAEDAPTESLRFDPVHDHGFVTKGVFPPAVVLEFRARVTNSKDFEIAPILWLEMNRMQNQHLKLRTGTCQLWAFDGKSYHDLSAPGELRLSDKERHQFTIRRAGAHDKLWLDGTSLSGYRGSHVPTTSGRIGLGGHGFGVSDFTLYGSP